MVNFELATTHTYLHGDGQERRFWFFFLWAQAGSLCLLLAQDAATFYAGFSLMTLAAWGLVIHRRNALAHQAARVYLLMALLGEALLLGGLIWTVHATGSLYFSDWGLLGAQEWPATAIVLLLLGLGVKAGLPLLHMWLPLAHPIAPTPASSVLSAVMLKAGIVGWLRCLPLGQDAWPWAGAALMGLACVGIIGGVLWGLAQRDPKALLAYSSVSQMGYLSLMVGLGLWQPALWPALLPVLLLYSLHHTLVKAALFLGTGVWHSLGRTPGVMLGMGILALALAGAPLTSGYLAKTEWQGVLIQWHSPWQEALAHTLLLAGLGTWLLMARLMYLLYTTPHSAPPDPGAGATHMTHRPRGVAWAWPWYLCTTLACFLPWGWASGSTWELAWSPAALWAAWPLPVTLVILWAAHRLRWHCPHCPPGDLWHVIEAGASRLRRLQG